MVTAIEGAVIDKARQSTTFCCECKEWIVVRHGFFKNTDVIYNVLEMVKLPCYVNRFFNCDHEWHRDESIYYPQSFKSIAGESSYSRGPKSCVKPTPQNRDF